VKTALFALTLFAVAGVPIGFTQAGVDWRLYGAASVDGASLCFYDANGQSLAYVYSRETKDAAHIAKVLTEDEARRIASNIAKLGRDSM
jgi:hypothetical protein